jgi:UDP-N-acetylglucosamine 4,6-dehydratase
MKRLLITGITGSFGMHMLKALERAKINWCVRGLSRCEKKQDDMKPMFPHVQFVVGDTRDKEAVRQAMRDVDYVFHAAALKQVPSCEEHVLEAIKTNILGTENVLTAAGEAGVKRVVTLSTDKACYPINAMGMTKALAEKLTLSYNGKYDTEYVCTRYGNVLRSRGSVVPLWESLAAEGKPLMLTNPRMTRFLMTLQEACELVLYALEGSEKECTYVLKSPAAYMEDVAKVISPNIIVDKIRPGEKLDEVLITAEEMRRTVDCGKYYRITSTHQQAEMRSFTSSTTRLLSQAEIRDIIYAGGKHEPKEIL